MSWKTARAAKPCNTYPDVWAAIYGCTGKGTAWRHTTGHFGRAAVEFACPTCRAARDAAAQLDNAALAAHLRAAQDRAGVADYRTAEVEVRDGRPVLTGRVSLGLAAEAVRDALYDVTEKSGFEAAAKALRVYANAGGDCRPLVANAKLTPKMLTALRAAYRAA